MTKDEWSELTKEDRLIRLRTLLQQLIALEKEQHELCKQHQLFKKTHLKSQLETQITNYIQWDSEL